MRKTCIFFRSIREDKKCRKGSLSFKKEKKGNCDMFFRSVLGKESDCEGACLLWSVVGAAVFCSVIGDVYAQVVLEKRVRLGKCFNLQRKRLLSIVIVNVILVVPLLFTWRSILNSIIQTQEPSSAKDLREIFSLKRILKVFVDISFGAPWYLAMLLAGLNTIKYWDMEEARLAMNVSFPDVLICNWVLSPLAAFLSYMESKVSHQLTVFFIASVPIVIVVPSFALPGQHVQQFPQLGKPFPAFRSGAIYPKQILEMKLRSQHVIRHGIISNKSAVDQQSGCTRVKQRRGLAQPHSFFNLGHEQSQALFSGTRTRIEG
ncbi:unnamed protein product [Notodromas monacha]|uniref:Uncharacterized protein n=1 Tax=Notodromas monacha TaxID=399045 RepID=A0A7R9BS95_9CRUS|nr:unnamed protein product [Notodromas monacha]CAG0920749.1 unnamed protein product [Notodromas monacha]